MTNQKPVKNMVSVEELKQNIQYARDAGQYLDKKIGDNHVYHKKQRKDYVALIYRWTVLGDYGLINIATWIDEAFNKTGALLVNISVNYDSEYSNGGIDIIVTFSDRDIGDIENDSSLRLYGKQHNSRFVLTDQLLNDLAKKINGKIYYEDANDAYIVKVGQHEIWFFLEGTDKGIFKASYKTIDGVQQADYTLLFGDKMKAIQDKLMAAMRQRIQNKKEIYNL